MTRPGTFEIRVLCTPDDADHITTVLAAAFTTGTVRAYPTRDRARVRLYVTALTPDPQGERP